VEDTSPGFDEEDDVVDDLGAALSEVD
jgi:hypothetical protein